MICMEPKRVPLLGLRLVAVITIHLGFLCSIGAPFKLDSVSWSNWGVSRSSMGEWPGSLGLFGGACHYSSQKWKQMCVEAMRVASVAVAKRRL